MSQGPSQAYSRVAGVPRHTILDWLAYIRGMEIAVAQSIAIRHVLKAIEQDLLPRLVERHGSGDARCQPTLQATELVRRVGMNACVQAREDLKILVYGARVAPHLLRE